MPLDFLRGPDDARVEAILHHARLAAVVRHAPPTTGDCPVCGMVDTLLLGDRCHQCDDQARDSAANRQMCALIHGVASA